MKDLQAMDRAHRIGQRKVVNVYRLITRSTLEEKIMGYYILLLIYQQSKKYSILFPYRLQKFKVQTANTVISGENSRLETMGTDQILDLFTNKPLGNQSGSLKPTTGSVKSILETLPELWDPKQYEDEFDLSNFMMKLSNNK